MKARWISLISVGITTAAWELGVRFAAPPPRHYVFTVSEMLSKWPQLFHAGLAYNVLQTVQRAVGGFLCAAVLGGTAGVVIGRSVVLHNISRPIIDFLRPLPSSALIPIVMILPALGFSERSYYTVVVFGTIWPILFGAMIGVARVDPTADRAMRLLPLTKFQRLRLFTLPEAAPEIFTGLKVALPISLILAVTAELLIGGHGLGTMTKELGEAGDYSGMYSVILVAAILGWLLNWSFSAVGRLHPWLRGRQTMDEVEA